MQAKLTPAADGRNTISTATLTIEREGDPQPLFAKEFAPREAVEIATGPLAVTAGGTLYLVLDAAPGGARSSSLDLDRLTVTLLPETETKP